MPFQFGMLETIIRAHHNIGSMSIKAKNPTRKNDLNAPRIPDPGWSRIPNIQLNVIRVMIWLIESTAEIAPFLAEGFVVFAELSMVSLAYGVCGFYGVMSYLCPLHLGGNQLLFHVLH